MPIPAFVEALERCIAELSATVTRTAPVWADHCESPGDKTHFQAPVARRKGLARKNEAILSPKDTTAAPAARSGAFA